MEVRKCVDCGSELQEYDNDVCEDCIYERTCDMELYYKEQEELNNERIHHV